MPGNVGWPSPVVTYTVPNPRPLLRGESDTGAVVMEGDATGLNNLAGLGLLNTDSAVYYAGTLARDPTRLQAPGCAGSPTGGHRHQPQAGVPLGHPDRQRRLHRDAEREPGQDATSATARSSSSRARASRASRTRRYVGAVNVTASSYGNSVSYTPEDQAYSAIDGNFDTAWIVGTFVPDPKGQWWQVGFANPVTTDHITVVQPQRGDRSRWVSDVTLTFDGKDPIRYQLNASSHVTAGQTLTFPSRTFHTLRVTIDGTTNNTRAAGRGRRRRLLGDRDPRPAGAPGRPDADPDAVDPRRRVGGRPAHRGDDPRSAPRNSRRAATPRRRSRGSSPCPTARTFTLAGAASLSALDPRRRDRPARGAHADGVDRAPGRVLLGPDPRRPAGHGVGHARRQRRRRPGSPASAPTRRSAPRSPTTWPSRKRCAGSTLQVIADGRHSVPTAMTVTSGQPGAHRRPAADRRRHRARRSDHGARVLPGRSPARTSSSRSPPSGPSTRRTTTRPGRWRCRSASPRSASPAWCPHRRPPPSPEPASPTCCRSTAGRSPSPSSDRRRTRSPTVSRKWSRAVPTPRGSRSAPARTWSRPRRATTRHARASRPPARAGTSTSSSSTRPPAGAPARPCSRPPPARPSWRRRSRAPPRPSRATSSHIDSHGARVSGAAQPFELVLGQSVNKGWHAVAEPGPGAPAGSHPVDLGTPLLVDGFANGWHVTAADLHASVVPGSPWS